MYSLKQENKSIQKKHLEQFLTLNPLEWDKVAIETIDGQLTQTLKCIGFINTKIKGVMVKYYIFTNNNDKIFKFIAKDWSIPKATGTDKTVYFKNNYRSFDTPEIAYQFVLDNKHIIQHKLNETQIFI
jgi:hypothetical protein